MTTGPESAAHVPGQASEHTHRSGAVLRWGGYVAPPLQRVTMVAGCSVLLFFLNWSVAAKLFHVEFTTHMHSVEGSFIALSRVLVEQPSEQLWWPYWNAGMPFEHAYVPLLQWMVALVVNLTGQSAALSYHVVTAFFYCFGPVAFFLMALGMSRNVAASILGGVFYSLISPSIFLFPAIHQDIGSLWAAQRLNVLVYYGAGPQITALALLPLAILSHYLVLQRRRCWLSVATGVAMAAVVLTNAFGAVTLALAVFCLLSARAETSFLQDLRLTLAISLPAYLWITPWLPPSLLHSMVFNAPTSGGDFRWLNSTVVAAGGVAAVFFLLWRVTRGRVTSELRFALLLAFLLTSIPVLGYFGDLHVLPQAWRYHTEMELAMCLLAVFGLAPLLDRATNPRRAVALLIGLGLVAWQWPHYRAYANELIKPADLERTIEYRIARQMSELFGNRRVMVSGSCSLWFNVFSDAPQLSGGHHPSAPNWIQRVAVFTIYSGMNAGPRDGEVAVLWLKAFGAHAVNVPGPGSSETYKPFSNPRQFEGLLPVAWQDDNDTIYQVPQRSNTLVYVVPRDALVTETPQHGLDVEGVSRYVAAIEDPSLPLANVTWRNSHSAVIRAHLDPEQVVSTQINYAAGWKATVGGARQPAFRDGLGLLAVRPGCQGLCEIELVYDGGAERTATRSISVAVTIGVLVWLAAGWRRRPRR